MKFFPLIFLTMWLAGCAATSSPKAQVQGPKSGAAAAVTVGPPAFPVARVMESRAEPLEAVPPPAPRPLVWTWEPGGYSNFVVVATTDLRVPLNQWPLFLTTTGTNFQAAPILSQQFFALYGTNDVGNSAWAQ